MVWWAIAGSAVVSSYSQKRAAEKASAAQSDSAMAGIDEQRRQFDAIQELLSPYVNSGSDAVGQQMALLGLDGADAQGSAISALESSPQFTSLVNQGEEALLQNASATGGVRGGNLQGALAQFSKLGQVASLGQASAAGQAAAGQATGSSIANLLSQRGSAIAGGHLARGNAYGNLGGGLATSALLYNKLAPSSPPPVTATSFLENYKFNDGKVF